jgi:hypothetical protein
VLEIEPVLLIPLLVINPVLEIEPVLLIPLLVINPELVNLLTLTPEASVITNCVFCVPGSPDNILVCLAYVLKV